MLDIDNIRSEYPILKREIFGKPLVYLDSAATSQTPRCVVDKIVEMYTTMKANVHRGVHELSQEATEMQERAREKVRAYINAASTEEIIFTRGTTEAINLVASSYGDSFCNGDEIILTVMEHHSDIVPWQLLQQHKRIRLRVVPIDEKGELRQDMYEEMFTENTRMVAICHVSNVLGTVNPVKDMIEVAHRHGVPVLIDGAQSMPHMKVDVQELDADFFAFSAHKMYGPTGVGVLYGKKRLLETMPPYQGGGEMIGNVSFEKTTFSGLPYKFEAGTPDFVGIAAFAEALDYIERIVEFCREEGIRLVFVTAPSFDRYLEEIGPYDLAHQYIQELADSYGILYLDFNLCRDEYLNLGQESYIDVDHLNGKGAAALTTLLSELDGSLAEEGQELIDEYFSACYDKE